MLFLFVQTLLGYQLTHVHPKAPRNIETDILYPSLFFNFVCQLFYVLMLHYTMLTYKIVFALSRTVVMSSIAMDLDVSSHRLNSVHLKLFTYVICIAHDVLRIF